MDQQGQATARLLTVLGPSGSGKSSIVMAGLLPKLKQGALPKSASWIYLDPIVPGKHPLEALTLTLTLLFPERSLKSIREDLEDDSARGLHLLLTTYVKQSGMSVLLVIEQPAQLPDVQLTFEEGLVGDLLFDVQGQVGALPLLQFTLDQLFQHREGRLLTQHAYHLIGGVKGALAQHAEATYKSLPTEKHQRLTRALFLRLINPGTVEEDATRRRVTRAELVVVDQGETTRLAEVTEAFTQARLLTTNTVGGVSTIEVSHEALIQAWTHLQDWLHEARDDMRLQQAISEDTASWNQHRQEADRLYRGSQLTEALRWRATNLPSLDEDRFLQASLKERFRSRRRTFLIGLISVAGITGTGFLVRTLLLGSEPQSPSQPIQPYTYNGHTNWVISVAWSPDGKRIASGSSDKTVQVWDANSSSHLLSYQSHTGSVWSVVWSPDGKRIASGSLDNTVRVWNASSR